MMSPCLIPFFNIKAGMMAQNFLKVEELVRSVLNSWPSYQFAIKNQLAGSLTNTKDEWFVEVLSAHLVKHKDVCPFALSDWIEDILDTEFSLISDDGTLEPTAKLLIELTDLSLGRGSLKGEEAAAKLNEHLQRLHSLSNKTCAASTTPRVDSSSESEVDGDDGTDEETRD